MIVRIQGEGQFELDDDATKRLDEIDNALFAAVDSGDEAGFHQALKSVVDFVERQGTPLALDRVVPSDVILPARDMSLDEARRLFTDKGYMRPVEA